MRSRFWLWFPVLAVSLILLGMEWNILPHLNHTFFGDYHDALKNYYTVLYHVEWDESYFHFEGMNYPYGEHVLFTDNQPLLSAILRFINQNLFQISPYIPGIINGLLLLSFPLCAWFLNLALRRLGCKPWIAALAATGMVFMNPQLNRIQRHFALAYSFIIPLLLYLGLLHLQNPKWKRSWLIALLVAGVAFIHAYYLGFALLIIGCLFLIGILENSKQIRTHFFHFTIQAIIPFVLVQLVMIITDPVSDRPAYPWSPFLGDFIMRGFVINYDNPVSVWLSKTLQLPYVDWEAKAYLGIYTILFTIFGLSALILKLIGPFRQRIRLDFLDQNIRFLILTAAMAVVVSFVYSNLSGNTNLFQYMGPMRQFRAVGRFYWVSFFALSLVSYSWLSYYIRGRKQSWKWLLTSAVLFLLLFDAFHASKKGFHRTHEEPLFISGSPEQVEMYKLLSGHEVLIPLPYFHIGSEDYALSPSNARHYKNVQTVSYASGIPMTANALSRTSLSQTLKLLCYHYWPVDGIPFLEHLHEKKSLLLVDRDAELSTHEKFLLESGAKDTLFANSEFQIISFDLEAYQSDYAQQDSIPGYYRHGSGNEYLFRHYEDDMTRAWSGSGSRMVTVNDSRLLDSLNLPSGKIESMKIGFWVYLNQSTKASEGVILEFFNGKKVVHISERKLFRQYLKALSDGWGFVETEVKVPDACTRVRIRLSENRLHPTPTFIDDLRVSLKGIEKPDEGVSSQKEKD